MGVILKLEHIQKYYGSRGNITRAIRDISFSVEKGEFLGIMGTSGSGKTTLLNCISTIDTVSAGHIYLEGVDVTEMKPKSLAGFRRENQVSGGQRQRCACARAIVGNPKLLLADEPTGSLDSHSSQMLLATIQSINEQLGATILMVTHDAFTASYANRILFLQDGEILTELRKGSDGRGDFFHKILNVLTMTGGGQSHVC